MPGTARHGTAHLRPPLLLLLPLLLSVRPTRHTPADMSAVTVGRQKTKLLNDRKDWMDGAGFGKKRFRSADPIHYVMTEFGYLQK